MLFWHLGVTAAIVYATLGRRRIDYRVVLLGALLPDLVDVPIGRFFLRDRYGSQHLWGHTLLLVVVLSFGVMLFLRGEAARRWFVLPMAALVHLGLDAMWSHPITFYWPLFGTDFPREQLGPWWHALARPVEILKELVGLGLLAYLGVGHHLQDPDHRRAFLKTGKLEGANPAR
jgi:inner membrane protein